MRHIAYVLKRKEKEGNPMTVIVYFVRRTD